jgi:hypothetical protein
VTDELMDETHHFLPPAVPYHDGKKTVGEAFEDFRLAWQRLMDESVVPLVEFARHHLTSWAEPPPSVMERALQDRKNRNTGPTRPSGQNARAPRRHQ